MTKQEIKEAIAKGIAGQGTNVDGGGYLPKILEAIVDAIPEGASPVAPEPTITLQLVSASNVDISTAAQMLGILEEEVNQIPDQLVLKVESYVVTRLYKSVGEGSWEVCFGVTGETGFSFGAGFEMRLSDGNYSFSTFEV